NSGLRGNNMRIDINKLDAELFLALYTSVGWEPPCKEQVEVALQNTIATFVAYENDTPVGMVRVIGDGGMSFYIKDFVVVPEYQSKGVGRLLIESIN
ncbi:MAG: GNAT family N-acetyltransferase, partial [Lachnospiraceae bacterium]|nr:GNAT family N-acetyltransferase [Lachnospiraceae bacterium]